MTANWTQPYSWGVGELVTASRLNEQMRDNLDWLKTPPQGVYTAPSNIAITNTAMADIMSPITITSSGGPFLVGFQAGMIASSINIYVTFDLHVDGVSQGGTTGIHFFSGTGTGTGFDASFVFYVAAKSAGLHTFKLRAMVSGGTATIESGVYNAQFWVREI